MSHPIHILGIGANGVESLSPKSRDTLRASTFVAGGRRHLEFLEAIHVETLTITDNLGDLVERLRRRGPLERCVVLASGDPLFYGIGAYLRHHLGADELVVEPAISSMQLAFARAKIPWADASIASIHGRPTVEILLPLLGRNTIGLFTEDGSSPSEVAEFFLGRGLEDYVAWVCEDLGSDRERVSETPLPKVLGKTFRDLNVLILSRRPIGNENATRARTCLSTEDRAFAQPESGSVLLTHQDIRAVLLNRFVDIPAEGPIWDVGAGLGGVSIDLARRFPARDVVAIERSASQLVFLKDNRRRFEAWNLRIVEGTAPNVLSNEPPPAAVFVGGSGGELRAILDVLVVRLRLGGVFVANFVGLENLALCLEHLRCAGWSSRVSQVQISRGEPLAGLTTFVPLRPVWIVDARRPNMP
jgi:precorrin-6B C5,15-methyltransferase / cobalt-precorrin-6B C5,C15-methyltransferase